MLEEYTELAGQEAVQTRWVKVRAAKKAAGQVSREREISCRSYQNRHPKKTRPTRSGKRASTPSDTKAGPLFKQLQVEVQEKSN